MDDARIRQLTEEVLGQISQPRAEEVHDLESRVAKLKQSERNYEMLQELNVRPRTTYLARVRNENEELS